MRYPILILLALFLSSALYSQSPTLLFSANFDADLNSSAGVAPAVATGVELSPGLFGNGATLSAGDVLQYPAADHIDIAQGSVSLWVRPDWNLNGMLHKVFVYGDNPRNMEMHHDENGALAFSVNTAQLEGLPIRVAFADGSDWQAGNWQFLTYTWDADRLRIYVNGQLRGETGVGFTVPAVAESVFHVGSDNGSVPFDGTIDELRIYDGPLAADAVGALYTTYVESFPLGDAFSVINRFGADVTDSGITLVDWEGPVRNPAMEYRLQGPPDDVYPLTVQLSTPFSAAYFNQPSEAGANGARKDLTLVHPDSLAAFLMSVYMDENGTGESFELTLRYVLNGTPQRQVIPVQLIDQDYERPLTYPVTVDFSYDNHPFIQNETVQAIITEAARDWAYYVDGEDLDTYPPNASWLITGAIGASAEFEVRNPTEYRGFYLVITGTDITSPCICSTGFPSQFRPENLQTRDGAIVPIPRMGAHVLNVRGNFNNNGYQLLRPYEEWHYENKGPKEDLYYLSKHEIGHAMVYEFLPRYNEFIQQGFISSPAIEQYYPGGQVILQPDSPIHLAEIIDPESRQSPYGTFADLIPEGREALTKLDLLIMEATGYPLRTNEVTRSLEVVLTDSIGRIGEPFTAAFRGRGGVPVYRYTYLAGELPAGLEFDSLGRITGTPAETGFFPLTVRVEDYSYNGATATNEIVLHILRQEAELLTFALPQQLQTAIFDTTDRTVLLEVPEGTDLTALVPTLTVSPGATVTPASGEARDFTAPVVYTVVSEDATVTSEWTVTVVEKATSAVLDASILTGFSLYPNPVVDGLNVSLELDRARDLRVELIDLTGRSVRVVEYPHVRRLADRIEIGTLPAGVYWLRVLADGRLVGRGLVAKG